MKNTPLITIGLPVYNGEKDLAATLDNLLSQNYKNFELLISDNASDDRTEQICLLYKNNDTRIKYFRQKKLNFSR